MVGNDSISFDEVELSDPVASGYDLLVRVQAVSVNPVDLKSRMTQNLGPLTADSLTAAHNSVAGGRTVGKVVL
jgi:NADPH:quinone reductase-like Zn-dependent oxidoreductase